MSAGSEFTSEEVQALRERLKKLVAVYLNECDPDWWPTVETQTKQQQRYWAKQQAKETLRQITSLQAILRKLPRDVKNSEGDETAALIEAARKKGEQLRARLRLVGT